MYKDVQNTLRQLPVVANDQDQAKLAQKQNKDPKLILPTDHTVFGTDFNGGLLMFDTNRVSAAKEPQVASVDSLIHVVQRWDSFEAFVKDAAARVAERLENILASDRQKTTTERRPKKGASKPPVRAKRR